MGDVLAFGLKHASASRCRTRRRRRPKVGTEPVTGNSCAGFDLTDALGWNLVLFPAQGGRFVDPKQRAELLKAQTVGSAIGSERVLHGDKVAYNATSVNPNVASADNDCDKASGVPLRMSQRKIATIHQGKTPQRIHFVVEWAELRGKIQADFAKDGVADKSTVSRWYDGQLPTEGNLGKIADYLGLDDVNSLFRHPDDDWIRKALQNRDKDERDRIKATIQMAFPEKTAKRG